MYYIKSEKNTIVIKEAFTDFESSEKYLDKFCLENINNYWCWMINSSTMKVYDFHMKTIDTLHIIKED